MAVERRLTRNIQKYLRRVTYSPNFLQGPDERSPGFNH